MLRFSAPTPCEQPASDYLHARLSDVARKLGVTDPSLGELRELLDCTFARPVGDSAYLMNQLQPGALPLEWSFSEADPEALRIELQPFDPALDGGERLRNTVTALMPVIEAHHGKELAAQFESTVRIASSMDSKPSFGAFLGLVHRPLHAPEFKIYVECDPGDQTMSSGDFSSIAGIVPHFFSVAVGAGCISKRMYYICRQGLRALDLEAVCMALGMSHRFPALLLTMLELTGGEFYLPPRSVLLGVRRSEQNSELKLELVCGAAMSPDGLIGRIKRLMQPDIVVAFQRWASSVFPENHGNLPVSVVSIKVSTRQSGRLSVYAAESWRE